MAGHDRDIVDVVVVGVGGEVEVVGAEVVGTVVVDVVTLLEVVVGLPGVVVVELETGVVVVELPPIVVVELPGVKDVQGLRLRRAPSRFGEVVFGPPVVFADPDDVGRLEASCGGNLALASREVAVFAADSKLMHEEVQAS